MHEKIISSFRSISAKSILLSMKIEHSNIKISFTYKSFKYYSVDNSREK